MTLTFYERESFEKDIEREKKREERGWVRERQSARERKKQN